MHRLILILILAAGVGLAQQTGSARQQPGDPPSTQGKARMMLNVIKPINSIEELIRASDMIAEVLVNDVRQARPMVPQHPDSLETDVVVAVRRLLKGTAAPGGKIVVTQDGGKLGDLEIVTPQVRQMKPGETYILFLTADTRTGLPSLGMPRFLLTGVVGGIFEVDQGVVHAPDPKGSPGLANYEGKQLASFTAEIQRLVAKTP